MSRREATADGADVPSGRSDPQGYLSFYELKTAPFRVSTDPQYLWRGKSRLEVLDTLTTAVRHGEGVLLLTGDIGTGKTTLVNALVERLGDDAVLVGRLFNFGIEPSEFLPAVAHAFGIKDDVGTRADLFAGLQALLAGDGSPARKALLVIDDAQDLSHLLLDEIRDLSLAASAHDGRLAILLVGHKKLNTMLSLDRHAALRQRISAGTDLDPLTPDEVGEYIRCLLEAAGARADIFTPEAMLDIATLSGGVPRVINMICDLALLTGLGRHLQTIDRDVVEEARKKLGSPRQIAARRVRPAPQRRPAARKLGDSNARLVRKRRGAARAAPVYVSVLAALVLVLAGYVLYHGWSASRPHAATEAPREAERARPASDANSAQPPGAAQQSGPAGEATTPELLIERVTHIEPAAPTPQPAAAISPSELKTKPPAPIRPSAAGQLEKPAEPIRRPAEQPAEPSRRPQEQRATAGATTPRPEPAPTQADDGKDPGAVIDWLLKEYAGEKR